MLNSFIWASKSEKQFILNTVNEGRITLFSFYFTKNSYR